MVYKTSSRGFRGRQTVSSQTTQTEERRPEPRLGTDLPSVACNAAIELDNLLLGLTTDLPSVRELCDKLTEEVPNVSDLASPRSLVDPSTVVVIHRVLRESQMGGLSDEIDELTRQAAEIVRKLQAVIGDPSGSRSTNEEGVKKLKMFCLLLSKRASGAKKSAREPKHPYRRQG